MVTLVTTFGRSLSYDPDDLRELGRCSWCGQKAQRTLDQMHWVWWHEDPNSLTWCEDGDAEFERVEPAVYIKRCGLPGCNSWVRSNGVKQWAQYCTREHRTIHEAALCVS